MSDSDSPPQGNLRRGIVVDHPPLDIEFNNFDKSDIERLADDDAR